MADEADSKSVVGNHVRVQVPLPAVKHLRNQGFFYFSKNVLFQIFWINRGKEICMSKYRIWVRLLFSILFIFAANGLCLIEFWRGLIIAPLMSVVLIGVNLSAGFLDTTIKKIRLKVCNHGVECLSIFSISLIFSIIIQVLILIYRPIIWFIYIPNVVFCVFAHVILFWNGIISVYCTSVQLGLKQRIIGAICGPIPIAHLFALGTIIKITSREVREETIKDLVNRQREGAQICRTKYPILLVHGVFFRDSKKLNYWGRIPAELERNGAAIFYGEHQSALSVEKSAGELALKIKEIVAMSGCEKVNIIAHSKGGLDCRYAIANLKVAPYVASLTTINTPHRGCGFADYLLTKIPQDMQTKVANTYNAAAKKLGDTSPDFMEAVSDLTESACMGNDVVYSMPEGIFCQSVGSVLNKATHGKFPLNLSYPLVKHFDGENDGLVSVQSFSFGENYTLLKTNGKRGISHADMIDLNRENIPGFDVREFYVQLVNDLRLRGL